MTQSEIAFLALGLVLGVALGASFLAAVRARPARRREVRVTITPNSIGARRAVTLADAISARDRVSPPGSQDDAGWPDRPDLIRPTAGESPVEAAAWPPPMRTRVPSQPARLSAAAVAIPVGGGLPAPGAAQAAPADRVGSGPTAGPRLGDGPETGDPSTGPIAIAASSVGAGVAVAQRPVVRTLVDVRNGDRPAPLRPVDPGQPALEGRPALARAAVGISINAAERPRSVAHADPPRPVAQASNAGDAMPAQATEAVGDCAPARTAAEERCAEAATARSGARAAADAMHEAQRAFDALRERVDRAREAADPRTIAALKAELHAAFRDANGRAASADEAEAAARQWLSGIDRANTEVRAARKLVETGTAELRERLPALDRLASEADAARVAAEIAEQGCRAAREELARCEELAAAAVPPAAPDAPHPFDAAWPREDDHMIERQAPRGPDELLGGLPAIVQMLRGSRAARDRVVAALAGGDPASGVEWQLRLSGLVDAIRARAIEAGYIDVPRDNPFWALFSGPECREIVGALSSLGYRFDGMDGFADGRVPAARDLSLAVGYAGLDPMRIRIWPREGELGMLYAGATVAADQWLSAEADDLALGSVIDALGQRGADLGDLWGAWGRIRPLLLAPD